MPDTPGQNDPISIAKTLNALPDPEAREKRLIELTQNHPELAAQVRALLGTTGKETVALPGSADPDQRQVQQIGPYRVIKRLGSGGMGSVYLAEQPDPKRLVAIKTLRIDALHSAAQLQRFAHEARFLAALDHPNIARIFEAGRAETEFGTLPYLAMEVVNGADLGQYAGRRQLSTTQRVRLVIAICAGIAHAHARGIVHRDLKPSNILITDEGEPKIVDFGIATQTEPGADHTRLTHAGEVLGTLQYMSPEQLGGDPLAIDTRSDIYSLGVILFELLCGSLPHDVGNGTLLSAIRKIQDEQPRRLRRMNPRISGELELIVEKALASEAAQRYQSVAEFAADLEAHLDSRPVAARAPSARYLAGKFVRRNRWAVAAASVMAISLLGATAWSLLAAEQARAALQEASERADELAAVNDFVGKMLTEADPELGGGSDMRLSQVLEGAERSLGSLADSPRSAGQVSLLLGNTWSTLGESERARALFVRSRDLIEQGFGTDSEEFFSVRLAEATDLLRRGEANAALELFTPLQSDARQRFGDDYSLVDEVTMGYAQALSDSGDGERALEVGTSLIERRGEQIKQRDPSLFDAIRYNIAYTLTQNGQFAEAETLLRDVLASEEARLGVGNALTLYTVKAIGQSLQRQGRLDEAEVLYRQVYEGRRQQYGPTHPGTVGAGGQLASVLNAMNRPAEAKPLLEQALEAETLAGTLNLSTINILAITETKLGNQAAANALLERSIAAESTLGVGQDSLMARRMLASAHCDESTLQDQAAGDFSELISIGEKTLGPENIMLATFYSDAAKCDLKRGDPSLAAERLQIALPRFQASFGPEHPRTRDALENLSLAEQQQKR